MELWSWCCATRRNDSPTTGGQQQQPSLATLGSNWADRQKTHTIERMQKHTPALYNNNNSTPTHILHTSIHLSAAMVILWFSEVFETF